MRYLLLFSVLLLPSCQSCSQATPIEAAQRLIPDHGFHVVADAGGELQVYPHALYYSGHGRASAAYAHRGQPVHVLEFEPGAAQFRLIAVDGSKVRLLATTCKKAHDLGHFTWIACEEQLDKVGGDPVRVVLEYDSSTGATTTPGKCGTCPVDDTGQCCCPDVTTGLRCPSAR